MKRTSIRITKPYLVEGTLIKRGARIIVEADDITTMIPPETSSDTSPDEEELDMYSARRAKAKRLARIRRMKALKKAEEVDDVDCWRYHGCLLAACCRNRRCQWLYVAIPD